MRRGEPGAISGYPDDLMTKGARYVDEVTRLKAVEREFLVMRRVLAITVQRLLELTGGDSVEITDAALQDAPGVLGWRNLPNKSVEIELDR